MKKRFRQIALAGVLLSAAALSLAAESEITWPQEWTIFGSIPSKTAGTGLHGRPRKADLLPGETLKTIPQELVISGQKYQGRQFRLDEVVLNLGQKLSCGGDATGAYLLAPLTATADTTASSTIPITMPGTCTGTSA